MATPTIESNFGAVKGYRKWYALIPNAPRVEGFVVDFETYIFQEEEDIDGRVVKNEITGIMIYFLVERNNKLEKCRAFLERRPYFYLLPKKEIDANFLAMRVRSLEEESILDVSVEEKYDMGELTFPKKKAFVRVVVKTPLDVPRLREQLEQLKEVEEWREADVQFHHRCAIDAGIRVGKWYHFAIRRGRIISVEESERKEAPELRVLCYDIEVDMEPTRDPNPEKDPISLIAVYTDDENYVLINKEAVTDVSEVTDFYVILRKPDADHSLPWVDWIPATALTNEVEQDLVQKVYTRTVIFDKESDMLRWFFNFIEEYKPDIFADFYGDRFDIPFLIHRSRKFGIDWLSKSGFKIELKMEARDKSENEIDWLRDVDYVASVGMFHVDAFLWTQKYSYLPKKDIALKNAVQKRLKIIPIGREALWAMRESPLEGIAYAGSDGYITYRFVKELVLDFCIAMGQMFPVPAAEILTKRAGSLDDLLIDSIAYQRNIVATKRYQQAGIGPFTRNLVIKNVAYTGGLVEARNPGVWRKDLKYPIRINTDKLDRLIEIIPTIIRRQAQAFLEDTKNEYFEQQVVQQLFEGYQLFDRYDEAYRKLKQRIMSEVDPKFQAEKLQVLDQIFQETENLAIENLEQEIQNKIEALTSLKQLFSEGEERKLHLQGMHADVTSMYPSQIRQYKIQPSGIVHPKFCATCKFKESDNSCMLDGLWTLKINLGKPCQYKQQSSGYCTKYRKQCPFSAEEEDNCEGYDAGILGDKKSQEIFTFNQKTLIERAYLVEDGKLREVPIQKTFFGSGLNSRYTPWSLMQKWVEQCVPGTVLSPTLGDTELEIAEVELPKDAFMFIDVRAKNITALVAVKSRVCQKAYDFVSAIMNDFFQKRVYHKKEAKRLKKYINSLKKSGKPVPEKILALQKFHDATQLGLKVPLNSIYGLLGMKGGVRNASAPSAGITTAFSAKLIKWTADYLEDFAIITELDTDGIWMFLPVDFPLFYTLRVSTKESVISSPPSSNQQQKTIIKSGEFGLLEQILNYEVDLSRKNEHYWVNDLQSPLRRETRSLLRFEQDGPYDMMLVMGKKKYVVYNRTSDGTWKEEELTGLETKRQDFSLLIKAFQEELIKGYLELWDQTSSLADVYGNVVQKSLEFYKRMVSGELDIEYYVKPKSINKPPEEYKSLQPHVACALILKELGYNIEPGMRIDMLQIKSGSGKKSDAAIPVQLFEFDIKTIQNILTRRGISTLAFMMGSVNDKKTLLRNILDMKEYVSNLFDLGRLFDRMVIRLMIAQKVSISLPKELPNASLYQKMLPREVIRLKKHGKDSLSMISVKDPERMKHRSSTVANRSQTPVETSIPLDKIDEAAVSAVRNYKDHQVPKRKFRQKRPIKRDLDSPRESPHKMTGLDKNEISTTKKQNVQSKTSPSTSSHLGLTRFFSESESERTSRKLKSASSSPQEKIMENISRQRETEKSSSLLLPDLKLQSSDADCDNTKLTASSSLETKTVKELQKETKTIKSASEPMITLLDFTQNIASSRHAESNKTTNVNGEQSNASGTTRKITDLRVFFSMLE